jgi:hypothetical protein
MGCYGGTSRENPYGAVTIGVPRSSRSGLHTSGSLATSTANAMRCAMVFQGPQIDPKVKPGKNKTGITWYNPAVNLFWSLCHEKVIPLLWHLVSSVPWTWTYNFNHFDSPVWMSCYQSLTIWRYLLNETWLKCITPCLNKRLFSLGWSSQTES